ncbi:MAG: hypothetical protein K9N47_28545 [Prosthecobacter sp.]|uniref:hypothetical protein n=1 Tax=Prosthecobacter sp. TaxID=1965333 RepID=UPI0026201550|nr:hypothetical protein [Prosthecobacter sp.]MCF7790101.1 hypothetical protein [Prosthecobacter sp.]
MSARKKVHAVGFWSEHLDSYGSIHPALVIDPTWEVADREKIIRYLKDGFRCGGMLCWHKFRLHGHDGERLTSEERSDGVWIWPEVLALYVEMNVRLPEAFVNHMRAVHFDPHSSGHTREEIMRMERCPHYWNGWCGIEKQRAESEPA